MTVTEVTEADVQELVQIVRNQGALLRMAHGLMGELGIVERDDKYKKAFLKFDAACRKCGALGPGTPEKR